MRELQKVRIWNPEKNEFLYSGGTPMMQSNFFKYSARCFTVHNMPYEYSTSLPDKNGVEIYEGDRIRQLVTKSPKDMYEDLVVIYENASFKLQGQNRRASFLEWPACCCLEVIGNVHQEVKI